ncbi:MAG TPA: thiolase domain-containing protein, partial [Spirochaetes bacterium]|nr:thiolase domain-containing protein [Spirochaetota bacterium]
MRSTQPIYVLSGGVSQFAKARTDKTFQALVKEAYDYILSDLDLEHRKAVELIDGIVTSYFSDHFTNQLMAGIMVQDYLGFTPKPGHRVEGGGATGGICFQEAWKAVASGYMDLCLAVGFETMSRVNTWKGNEFIALASDTQFDFPVGGFYSGYYAMMVARHMKEFGSTVDQLSMVAVKNRKNAIYNSFAQNPGDYDLEDIQNSDTVAWPLNLLDICTMSDGAAGVLLASEEGLNKIEKATGHKIPKVKVTGIGRGTDMMRMADRPHGDVILMPHETQQDYEGSQFVDGKLKYPGIHS